MIGYDEVLPRPKFLPSSRGPPVAIRRMLHGHYGIGCLLETCQATPLMIWEAYAASTYVFLAPKYFFLISVTPVDIPLPAYRNVLFR